MYWAPFLSLFLSSSARRQACILLFPPVFIEACSRPQTIRMALWWKLALTSQVARANFQKTEGERESKARDVSRLRDPDQSTFSWGNWTYQIEILGPLVLGVLLLGKDHLTSTVHWKLRSSFPRIAWMKKPHKNCNSAKKKMGLFAAGLVGDWGRPHQIMSSASGTSKHLDCYSFIYREWKPGEDAQQGLQNSFAKERST